MARVFSHPLITPLLIALIVLACGFGLGSSFYLRVAALVWISALAAIGLNLLMGFAGQRRRSPSGRTCCRSRRWQLLRWAWSWRR